MCMASVYNMVASAWFPRQLTSITVNTHMPTKTQWERLLDPVKTAEHIHVYANDVYHNRLHSVDQHILYTLAELSQLNKREQRDWYIVEDVIYHLPSYRRIQHRLDPETRQFAEVFAKTGEFKHLAKKTRTQ